MTSCDSTPSIAMSQSVCDVIFALNPGFLFQILSCDFRKLQIFTKATRQNPRQKSLGSTWFHLSAQGLSPGGKEHALQWRILFTERHCGSSQKHNSLLAGLKHTSPEGHALVPHRTSLPLHSGDGNTSGWSMREKHQLCTQLPNIQFYMTYIPTVAM